MNVYAVVQDCSCDMRMSVHITYQGNSTRIALQREIFCRVYLPVGLLHMLLDPVFIAMNCQFLRHALYGRTLMACSTFLRFRAVAILLDLSERAKSITVLICTVMHGTVFLEKSDCMHEKSRWQRQSSAP